MLCKEALIMDFFDVGRQLFSQFFHINVVSLMKKSVCLCSDWDIGKIISYGTIVPVIYVYAIWMVWLTIAVCATYIILMHVHRLQNCYYLDTMTSSYLKWFPDLVRFHFQGGFSFLTMLRCAKCSFGPVAPLLEHLRNRAWPRAGHCSLSFLFINYSNHYPSRYISYILCVCRWVWLINPTLCIQLVWQV